MYRVDNVVSLYGPPVPTAFVDLVQIWSVNDVVQWLRGLDDCVLPYIAAVAEAGIDGSRLLMLTYDDLVDMHISSVGVRQIIMQGVELLVNLCYNMEHENLQSLAMTLCVRARNLQHEMISVSPLAASIQQQPSAMQSRRQIVNLLNRLCVGVSYVAEETKKIVFWLDRSPFDRLRQYVALRNQIMDLVVSMVKAANVPSKDMLSSPTKIANNCEQLCFTCEQIIRDIDDPLILYTATLERAILRKTKPTCEWGVNLQSSYRGVHVISEVKMQSPADVCGKVDAGDEILQINGQTVVGWDLSKVAQRLAGHPSHDLMLLLKKRPRELLALLGAKSTPGTPQPVNRRAPARLPPPSPIDEQPPVAAAISPKKRRRSNSMTTPRTPLIKTPKTPLWNNDAASCAEPNRAAMGLFSPMEKRLPPWELAHVEPEPAGSLERRATICGGSPLNKRWTAHLTRNSCDPRPHSQWFQPTFASNSTNTDRAPVVVCRSRTMRGQPDKFVRSLIDNKLVDTEVDDVDDNIFSLPEEPAIGDEEDDPYAIDYAHIDLVDPKELEHLGIVPVDDQFDSAEWKQNRPRATRSSGSSVEDSPIMEALVDDLEAIRPFRRRQPQSSNIVAPFERSDSPSGPLSRSVESHEKLKRILGDDVPRQPVQSSFGSHKSPAVHRQHKMVRNEIALEGMAVSLTRMRPLQSVFKRNVSEGPPDALVASSRRKCESAGDLSPPDELKALSLTPCAALDRKTVEGWVRRRRLAGEPTASSNGGKWFKRWLALRSNILFMYESPLANEAEVVVAVAGFTVCDAPELKSSKKHVFKLVRDGWSFFFACYTFEDMKSWMNKIGLATIGYHQTEEERTTTDTISKGFVYFPVLSDPSSAAYQSLPQSTIFGTGPRFRNRKKAPPTGGSSLSVNRQGSMTSAHSGHSTDSTGTNKDIMDPLRPKGRRRKPIPCEMLP
uniref:Connector enhancer of kinase suppressor of ras 2 n=1 Tax=Plectus sambesii TaxID=2011161 RepID=A0A914W941_9BILA